MVHMLSKKYYDEFISNIGAARFTLAQGKSDKECTLLIKSPTLNLRFLIKHKIFKILVAKLPRYPLLWYAVYVEDDPEKALSIWSIVEDEDELNALRVFLEQGHCYIFLFNEGTINVAWAEVQFDFNTSAATEIVTQSNFLLAVRSATVSRVATAFSDELTRSKFTLPHLAAFPRGDWTWNEIQNNYITEAAKVSTLKLLSGIEGNQQEQLALWIIDSIVPAGAYIGPKTKKHGKEREFVDVLLTYDRGSFLFESKALSIYERAEVASRAKLTRSVIKDLRKAVRQLRGATETLRSGSKIYDADSNELTVERQFAPHCVVLIPDLTLLSESDDFGSAFLQQFAREERSYLHVLDPPELMSILFSTNRTHLRTKNLSRAEAFDYVLLMRWEKSLEANNPYFRYHILFPGDEIPDRDIADVTIVD